MKLYRFFLACSLLYAGSQFTHAEPERRRSLPQVEVSTPAASAGLTETPEDSDFYKYSGLQLPLTPLGQTNPDENASLAVALNEYKATGLIYDFSSIDVFLVQYPDSAWRAGLLINKGLAYRHNGFIGSSFPVLEEVWQLAKDAEHPSVKAYADRAIAELIAIKAGLGRQDELEVLFAQTEGRNFNGKSAELIANAKLGVASMENDPERSFNCGPVALVNVLNELEKSEAIDARIMAKAATTNGLSLVDVAELADLVGFSEYSIAFREPRKGAYVTPSILHWKEGHFSALLRQDGDRYLIQDPTLGNKMWVPEAALDVETSGYFLIAQSDPPEGWRAVNSDEAATIWGKGKTTLTEGGATRPYDEKSCEGDGENRGMPAYSVHLLLASLSVTDTPIWVNTPYGNPVPFTVTYNQRETSLPNPNFATQSNMGANWTNNWQSWADGSGSNVVNVGHQTVSIAVPGGGLETFELNTAQTAYEQQRDTQATLSVAYNGAVPEVYTLNYPDGSSYIYGLRRTFGLPTRYFLTEMVDPYGNTVTLNYDADYRLTTVVTDSLPTAALTFVYEYNSNGDPVLPASSASEPEDYLIKEVVGPQGRYASFSYDASWRIDGITDMAGLEASFGYGTNYMSRMVTPYGQTTFEYPTDNNVSRAILIADPEGQQERFEFSRADVSAILGVETAPPGASKGGHFTNDLNTFHWDKRAMETAVNADGTMDYSQAVLYHWMQADPQRAASVLHSIKRPLENREWLIYDDSPDGGATIGATNRATGSSRYVKDETGATVLRTVSFEYNALGKPTKAIDPQGREVKMTYASNGIDLLKVEQRTGAGANDFEILTDLDYDEDNDTNIDFPHLPSLVEGAAGVVLDMTYNSKGQILSVTRKAPNGQGNYTDEGTTDYTYFTSGTGETYGFLQKVEGPSVAGVRPTTSYTYDAYGRVRTATDSENYMLTYDYDDLDRVTKVSYPDGTFTSNLYEPFSEGLDLVAFIDRLGRMSQFRHDDLGRVVQSIDLKGQSTIYNWCGCGSLTSITDSEGKTTTWMRDVQGRVEKKIYDDNSEISYSYEPESGLLSTVTDQRGFVKQFKYFVDGNIEEISFNDGGTSDPDYIDAPTVNYTYEDYFNRTSTLTTAGSPDDYTYSYYGFTGNGNANRLETVTINKLRDSVTVSNDIDFAYDSLGRLYTRGFKGDTETYLYDELDRLDDLNDPLGDFDYSYENLTSRILSVQHSVSGVNGIRTDLSYEHKTSGGQERKVPYLESILHSTSNGTIAAYRYIRNDNGRIDLWQQFDGSDWQSHGYRYDQAGQLQTDRKFDGLDENSALLERNEFRYDRAGNRSLFQDASGQINATHNDLNQLTAQSGENGTLFHGTISEAGKVFVQQLDGSNNVLKSQEAELHGGNEFYANLDLPVGSNTVRIKATDIHGETTTQDYSYNVTADVGDSFLYDDAGNLTDWTKANGTHIEYKWDAANRLRSVNVNSALIQSFEYDGAGRMTRATDASGNRNDYFWDGLERLGRENVDVSPTVERRYLAQGFTESLDGAPASKYYITKDHLGSTREVLDDGYAVVAKYDYTAWGDVEKLSGSVNSDLLYTGHLHFEDADTPLHFAPYRTYQPQLGRWLNRDPIAENGGINLYGYVGNSPINRWDPNGLDWLDTAANFSAGFGDHISFGATRWLRDDVFSDFYEGTVDYCSDSYRNGDYAGYGFDAATLGGSGGLRALAAINRGGYQAARHAAKGLSRRLGPGLTPHHIFPLRGHPLNVSQILGGWASRINGARTYFPSAGLGSFANALTTAVTTGAKSQAWLSRGHAIRHASLYISERALYWGALSRTAYSLARDL